MCPNEKNAKPKPNRTKTQPEFYQNLKQAKSDSGGEKLFHWNQLLLSMEQYASCLGRRLCPYIMFKPSRYLIYFGCIMLEDLTL